MINLLPPEKQKRIKTARNRLFFVKVLLVTLISAACILAPVGIIYYSSTI